MVFFGMGDSFWAVKEPLLVSSEVLRSAVNFLADGPVQVTSFFGGILGGVCHCFSVPNQRKLELRTSSRTSEFCWVADADPPSTY